MTQLEDLFEADRVLVFGIGGGGDVVGCIPTADLLRIHDVDVLIGGLAWERVPHDPQPGPRSFEEVEGHDPIADTVAWCHADTRTHDGVVFTESIVADHTGEDTLLVDPTHGPAAMAEGFRETMGELDLDHIVALDAGGDVLARGDEPGLQSPLADALTLSALERLTPPPVVGVIGWGSDGELSPEDLESAYARVARAGGYLGAWGMTPSTVDSLRPLLEKVTTEASRLPWESALGHVGERTIRGGRRTLHVGHASNVTIYLDARTVAAQSGPVDLVQDATSVDEADRRLLDAGYNTELAFERDWAAQHPDATPPEPT